MWEGVNKRRFPRVNYDCKVTVFEKGKKEEFSARTENIGRGGVCVILKKGLAKFRVVELVLFLENGLPPLECTGRVVWVVNSKNGFDTGIEFLNVKDEDAARIERIIQECLKTQEASPSNNE